MPRADGRSYIKGKGHSLSAAASQLGTTRQRLVTMIEAGDLEAYSDGLKTYIPHREMRRIKSHWIKTPAEEIAFAGDMPDEVNAADPVLNKVAERRAQARYLYYEEHHHQAEIAVMLGISQTQVGRDIGNAGRGRRGRAAGPPPAATEVAREIRIMIDTEVWEAAKRRAVLSQSTVSTEVKKFILEYAGVATSPAQGSLDEAVIAAERFRLLYEEQAAIVNSFREMSLVLGDLSVALSTTHLQSLLALEGPHRARRRKTKPVVPAPNRDGVAVAKLIEKIKASGLTQYDVAKRTGLSKSTISKLASGDSQQPLYDTIQRLEALAVEREVEVDL